MSMLLSQLTEFSSITPIGIGSTPSNPNDRVTGFGSSGFISLYDDGSNQIRHAIAYMAYGYNFGVELGALAAFGRDVLKGEFGDAALGVAAARIGNNLKSGWDYRQAAHAVASEFCDADR